MLGFLFNLVPVVLRVGAATVAMADFMGLHARAPTGLRLRGVRNGDGWWPGYRWLRNVVHSTGARDQNHDEYQAASSSHGRPVSYFGGNRFLIFWHAADPNCGAR